MDKIYSRRRIKIPKIYGFFNNNQKNKKTNMFFSLIIIIVISIITATYIIKALNPIVDTHCQVISKSIATKISNEQATNVMSRYEYKDLCNIVKDNNGNISLIKTNIIAVNEIISDIAIKIQEELNKKENEKFYINLGSFTGARILSGVGPKVEIKMNTVGNVETDLRSEFISSGINQTLHKIYLQVDCNVIILTPFNSIEQKITNQVLIAEAVIVGITPNTYYNLEGLDVKDTMEVIN